MEVKEPNKSIINFKEYFSTKNYLPFDSPDPFYQDLKDFASDEVLQIMLVGKPKVGKSTFAKLLSLSINIEYIDLE